MSTSLDRDIETHSTFRLTAASAPPAGTPWIDIDDGSGKPRRIELSGDSAIVGRVAPAQVLLEDPTVSRRHAEFFRDPFGRWWVRDLASRNGTLVNGAAAREHLLSNGDRVAFGAFTIVFWPLRRLLPVDRPASKSGDLTLIDSAVEAMRAKGAPAAKTDGIRSLHEIPAPHVDARHLQTLSDFSQRLLATQDAAQRLEQLCRLMIGLPLLGRWAAGLRLPAEQGVAPDVLCEASAAPDAPRPHVSKSVLRAVVARREGVLAGNQSAADVQMSVSTDSAPMSAIACPLSLSESESAAAAGQEDAAPIAMDVLYAVFPPHLKGGDWLALVSLACRQYRQAESVWAARRQAESHAVIEHDLGRAREIQMRLLPRNLNVPGLKAYIGFQPSRWVGGDYVDVISMPDGRAMLMVADVAGKGIAAALIAFGLHTAVHAGVAAGMDLAALGATLNQYVAGALEGEGYVTMFAALVDPRTGEIDSFNAGHPRPVIVDRSGGVRRAGELKNLPLGLVETVLPIETATLAAGELLVLFTDGLTELFDAAGNMLDDDGLAAILAALWPSAPKADPAASLQSVADQMKHRLESWQGRSGAEDDRTFLLETRG